jgi:flagellar biosynthesis protein FlhB
MSGQRTEKATPRRLQKAREKGQFPSAKDFVGAVQYLGIVMIISAWGASWFRDTQHDFRSLLLRAFSTELDMASTSALAKEGLWRMFIPLGMAAAGLMGITLLAQLASTNMGVSLKRLAPSADKFSPLARLKQIPRQNLPNALQAALLMAVMGYVLYLMIQDSMPKLMMLPLSSLSTGVAQIADSMGTLLWRAAGILLVFGFVELIRTRWMYHKDMRMSKQDIRDEMKESEGNPQIKGQIRRLRRELLRRRMMQDVPTATAVIVNPTHYAVAIRYEMDSMASPLVVAKGKNYLALRIRQKAIENGVPIVENPPLARGLYTAAEVGQEIPAEFYRAVAEVLAYIYRLMGRRRIL